MGEPGRSTGSRVSNPARLNETYGRALQVVSSVTSESSTPVPPAPGPARAAALLAAAFAPTVVFVNAGNNVVLNNLLDIPYDLGTTALFLAGFVLSTLALVPVFLRATRSTGFSLTVRFVIVVGVCALVFNVAGRFTQAPGLHPLLVVGVDLALLLAIGVLIERAPMPVLLPVCAVAGAVLFGEGTVRHLLRLGQLRSAAAAAVHQPPNASPAATADAQPGNVYHFVLDGFQSATYAQVVAANPELRPDQFTVYPGFTSHYGHTAMSVPNALLGRLYSPEESAAAWMREGFTGGLWAELERAGVGVALYPFFAEHCPPRSTHCIPAPLAGRLGRSTLIDLWFLSMLPRSVETRLHRQVVPAVWDSSLPLPTRPFSITTALGGVFATRRAADVEGGGVRVGPGDYAATSVLAFEDLLEAEARRPARGQYVFLHAILPHQPYLLDGKCGYRGEGWAPERIAYPAQAECALRLIERFTDRLKALGRFDDALIVLHADHGLWREPADFAAPGLFGRPEVLTLGLLGGGTPFLSDPAAIARRSSALLLLKLPGQTEARESAAPAQMLDIVPTVLHHVGLTTDAYPGIPLQALDEAADRERVFFSNPFGRGWNMEGPLRKFVMVDGVWEFREELPLRE